MPFFHILVLAVVQGITEFLPISSSGHLLIIPTLTGWADQGLVLDISVHVGTLVAVVLYFRKDIMEILMAFLAPRETTAADGRKLGYHIIIASIPVVIAGAGVYYLISSDMRSILLVAATTIIFGLFLGWADMKFPVQKDIHAMTAMDALVIGLFQVLALLPGTSRSGITMSAARIRGLSRTEGAHFSMLLSIPIIFGAGLLAAISLISAGNLEVGIEAVTGAVVSCLVAVLAISLLMRWIGKIGFMPFVIYRLLLGVLLIGIYFLT
ncbi:undecaprenyl-diphosphate phosphatase [Sneathiella sp.]|uniref:undecaprenyl-diphosphate phosphatase n=1 Tax=Sneathiella sp. TaxID=1964365 RepID=UPI00356591DA